MPHTHTDMALRDPDLLHARDAHFSRLSALFAGESLERPLFIQGISAQALADPYAEPERWVGQALDSLAEQADKSRDPVVFRPLCVEFGPYGVHFIDRMFSARVYQQDGQWWSDCLESPVGSLQAPDLERDGTWLLARRIAWTFLARNVSVPLFVLPTIASALNIAVNLHGEKLLVSLLDEPAAAQHDLAVINDLLCRLHRWYLAEVPLQQLQPVVASGRCQPPGFGQLCGCTTHLLSREMYRDFVAPLDDALLSVYPHGGMIHLCGVHTQHIPVWREMRSLRAVQINDRAAADLEVYLDELRDDQVIYLNPSPEMPVGRALRITGGRRIVLVAEPAEGRPEA